MTDISLRFPEVIDAADFVLSGGVLSIDDGLRTAIIISLFTDARAADDDVLPQLGGDRRGWWGDAEPDVEGDQIGSKLWLLERSKITPTVLNRAREYSSAALAWLLADGIVSDVAVEVETHRPDTLAIGVTIERPDGPGRQRFDFVWDATL